MTHAELVERAARWLRNTQKCGVVLTERACGNSHETPDAIGWRFGVRSTLVECKVSRADFLRDREKPFRIDPSQGMGQRRYFMTPPGLVKPDELPYPWGLVEIRGSRAIVVVSAVEGPLSDRVARNELALLYSFARRAQLGVEPTVGCLVADPKQDAAKAALGGE